MITTKMSAYYMYICSFFLRY